jgi:peptidoglycan/xylan/chitin deacetylase (PgdA/CDA1 family)
MKKFVAIVSALLLMLWPLTFAQAAFAAQGPNLIANSSAELVNGAGQPADWAMGGWGANTGILTVANEGYSGAKSLKAEITAYTNGDTKWFATPVAVEPGKNYTFSDWYKASIASELVIQYQNTAGAYSYVWLASPEASASWKQVTATFTVPAGMAKASVFHLISKVGSLQTDDAFLGLTDDGTTPTPPTPPTPPTNPPTVGNLIPNPSFETANGTVPAQWTAGAWGTNNATFTYLNNGQDGSRSVRAEITAYTNGDAKWSYAPQPVSAGAQYQFSNFYQSSVATDVNFAVTMANGTVQWYWAGTASPSATWKQFKVQFTAPAGAVSVQAMHILYSVGWLNTDNYVFAPYAPTSFNRAFVSLTFDDAWRSIYTNGLPVLNKYGFKSTQYLLSGETNNSLYMSVNQMLAFKNGGHEIASHTISHEHLTQLTPAELDRQLKQSQTDLQRLLGVKPVNFATPYGEYNDAVITNIKKYYSSHRGVETGFNSKDSLNIYNIKVQNILSDTTAAQVAAWVAQAQQTKTWLVLVYHEIGTNHGGGVYTTTTATFDAQMKAVKQSGITVVTVQQALNELKPQL